MSTEWQTGPEIQRRTAMRYLTKICKCRDITLISKIKAVQTLVFPVVVYGCESWTVRKADRKKMGCFRTLVLVSDVAHPMDHESYY